MAYASRRTTTQSRLPRRYGFTYCKPTIFACAQLKLRQAMLRVDDLLEKEDENSAVANRLRRRTSDQTVLGSNPAVAAALSPWTRLFTPIVPRRSLHISFY